jgi:hypothetical protein
MQPRAFTGLVAKARVARITGDDGLCQQLSYDIGVMAGEITQAKGTASLTGATQRHVSQEIDTGSKALMHLIARLHHYAERVESPDRDCRGRTNSPPCGRRRARGGEGGNTMAFQRRFGRDYAPPKLPMEDPDIARVVYAAKEAGAAGVIVIMHDGR